MVDEITEELTSEDAQKSCFMLTGMRGSGKTVAMTAIERRLEEI